MKGRSASLWSSDGKGVEISDARRERRQFRCVVTLHDEGHPAAAAELDMIGPYQSMMQEFFERLASVVTTFEGTLSWDSEFAEVAIDFMAVDPANVRVGADVRPTSARDEGYRVEFMADPNAVARWAADVAALAASGRDST